MAGIFKDVVLRWYMSFPRTYVLSYSDLAKKIMRYFSASKHRKVSTTSLFNVRKAQSESLREYMACFNEEIIKVFHLNQEIFVRAFQNKLWDGHLNESLAQKSASNMEEAMNRADCYIKG